MLEKLMWPAIQTDSSAAGTPVQSVDLIFEISTQNFLTDSGAAGKPVEFKGAQDSPDIFNNRFRLVFWTDSDGISQLLRRSFLKYIHRHIFELLELNFRRILAPEVPPPCCLQYVILILVPVDTFEILAQKFRRILAPKTPFLGLK